MVIARVIGNVWATKKDGRLSGEKFMLVTTEEERKSFVAVDNVGAGIGEKVLITFGSGARISLEKKDCPIDAAIVGILD